jgi:hypothetical protein
VGASAPVTAGWSDEHFTVYESDKHTGHGTEGSTLLIEQVDPLDPERPPCTEGSGGDFCGRSAVHAGPHVRCSAELIATGFRIVAFVTRDGEVQ